MTPLNLADALGRFHDHWHPRIVGRVNDTEVKLAKLKGEFIWHAHEKEDEMFLVLKGRLLMQFRDRDEWVGEGEMIIVPRGVEHRPKAPEEVHLLLVEPAGTVNTGGEQSERTVEATEL